MGERQQFGDPHCTQFHAGDRLNPESAVDLCIQGIMDPGNYLGDFEDLPGCPGNDDVDCIVTGHSRQAVCPVCSSGNKRLAVQGITEDNLTGKIRTEPVFRQWIHIHDTDLMMRADEVSGNA